MKVSYLSDLHLEFMDFPDFTNDEGGDVLILAGDIVTANYLRVVRTDKDASRLQAYLKDKFKRQLIDKYTHVYYVMGNHEHYRSMFRNTKGILRDAFNALGLEKIKIFDNDAQVLNGVAFLGCTLWSDFFGGSPQSMQACEWGMNDFRIIGQAIREGKYAPETIPVTAEFILQEHKQSLEFLKMMLEMPSLFDNKKVVVFTHHAPTLKSLNSQHCGNGIDGAYASDLSEFILNKPQITHWIHGHTHQNFDYMVGTCNVLANQRGYDSERSYIDFTGTKSFEI